MTRALTANVFTTRTEEPTSGTSATFNFSSNEEVAMTVAPAALANCMAAVLMPPVPCVSTVIPSPAIIGPSNNAFQAVPPAVNSAGTSASSKFAGARYARQSSTTLYCCTGHVGVPPCDWVDGDVLTDGVDGGTYGFDDASTVAAGGPIRGRGDGVHG
ncbi:hypothetical protein K490DRAFT_54750 [Saccharata proteae CBS 121410]|uniref:Uncharacterized protein n=1 Tax=Saccharata proteae CBS 121410 TaxID=1314787 RepID=A0A9P4HWB1_9PEZI|nr:hypothetical protein K490DRAFT_54750 [Saccharata proteae CBS 121410]